MVVQPTNRQQPRTVPTRRHPQLPSFFAYPRNIIRNPRTIQHHYLPFDHPHGHRIRAHPTRLGTAPHTLIGKQLDVNYSEYVVEMLYRGQRVASHARLNGAGRRYSTQSGHMPQGHREMAEWTPERIVRWAASVGVHT